MTAIQSIQTPSPLEILRAQDEGGVEFVDGQLVEKPVSRIASYVATRIIVLLGVEADKTGSALVFDSSMGYQCFSDDPRKFRKPDVSVVRSERMAGLELDPGLFPIAPDLAVEVVSPNDKSPDVDEKVEQYLAAGFLIVWVVQTRTKTVTIHRRDGTVTKLYQNDEITGEIALPTFKCTVAEFFAMPKR